MLPKLESLGMFLAIFIGISLLFVQAMTKSCLVQASIFDFEIDISQNPKNEDEGKIRIKGLFDLFDDFLFSEDNEDENENEDEHEEDEAYKEEDDWVEETWGFSVGSDPNEEDPLVDFGFWESFRQADRDFDKVVEILQLDTEEEDYNLEIDAGDLAARHTIISIKNSGQYQVRVNSNSEMIEDWKQAIDCSKKGNTIKLKLKDFSTDKMNKSYHVIIDAPISELKVKGGVPLEINGENLKLSRMEYSGLSAINWENINLDKLDLIIEGGLILKASGKVQESKIEVRGGSTIDCSKLETEKCNLKLTGAVVSCVAASDELNVDVAGLAKVYYYGNPKVNSNAIFDKSVEQVQ
ncbi:MAG: hypothetical protein GX217_05925 [Clostridiaceae bacterium]|nr:hypothetical protein [Clostridiaceae bacterium]